MTISREKKFPELCGVCGIGVKLKTNRSKYDTRVFAGACATTRSITPMCRIKKGVQGAKYPKTVF